MWRTPEEIAAKWKASMGRKPGPPTAKEREVVERVMERLLKTFKVQVSCRETTCATITVVTKQPDDLPQPDVIQELP